MKNLFMFSALALSAMVTGCGTTETHNVEVSTEEVTVVDSVLLDSATRVIDSLSIKQIAPNTSAQ